jgi:hypothetical protein
MQAPFRNRMRLQSETSTLETDKQVAEYRLTQREAMAQQEREFERRELERRSEAERIKIAADAKLQAFRLDQQRDLVTKEESLHAAQAALGTERQRHKAALAAIEDEIRRREIETSNTEAPALALVKQLPAAIGALKVNQLNLGDDSLRLVLQGLARTFGKSDRDTRS